MAEAQVALSVALFRRHAWLRAASSANGSPGVDSTVDWWFAVDSWAPPTRSLGQPSHAWRLHPHPPKQARRGMAHRKNAPNKRTMRQSLRPFPKAFPWVADVVFALDERHAVYKHAMHARKNFQPWVAALHPAAARINVNSSLGG